MAIWIDSAEIQILKKWIQLPFIKGITTNPLILKQANVKDRFQHLLEIQKLLSKKHEFMVQAVGKNAEELLKDAQLIHSKIPSAIIKIPSSIEGFEAASKLDKNIKTCFTIVYSGSQGIFAAAAGATYIAPYIGRMKDAGIDAWKEISEMKNGIQLHRFKTKILAASLRTPEDVSKCLSLGCEVTLKPSLLETCINHPATLKNSEEFNQAAGIQ